MKENEWETLVRKLEIYAEKNPSNYRLRVGLLAILGYAYLILVLVGLLAAIALLTGMIIYARTFNAAFVKIFIFLIIPIPIIIKSLFIKIPPPQGLELTRQEAPQLFSLIDQLKQALSSIPIDHVLLTSDLNAAVSQIPIFGLFGWQKNYLIIGLPLLLSLSPEQFKAVLAHEFGHLSGNHSRFAGWIYRVRQTWTQIFTASESQGSSVFFARFFQWYYPFFNAYSFVLARSNEYEADRCAAELAGSDNIAEALINVEIKFPFIENNFWKGIYERTKEDSEPPKTPFNSLATALHTIDQNQQQRSLQQALIRQTDLNDTHPCLKERLTALGYVLNSESLANHPSENAAQYYLGEQLNQLIEKLNEDWIIKVNYQWHENYNYFQQIRQSLAEIEEKLATNSLNLEEAWNRALWTWELEGDQAAIPKLDEVLQSKDNHVSANYLLGQILINNHDQTGIKYLEKAMSQDPKIVIECCQMLSNFFSELGEETEAEKYRQRSKIHYQNLLEADQERSKISPSDHFEADDLPLEEKENLQQHLAMYPNIKEAYLVKKIVNYFPDWPFYVLAVKRKSKFWENAIQENQSLLSLLTQKITVPYYLWIVVFSDPKEKMIRKIIQASSGKFYSR